MVHRSKSVLSFQLVVRYFILFSLSTLLIFGVGLYWLNDYVSFMERERIAERVEMYKTIHQSYGIEELQRVLRMQHRSNEKHDVFVRLVGGGAVANYENLPDGLKADAFEVNRVLKKMIWEDIPEAEWFFVDLPVLVDLDVFALRLSASHLLIVGRTTGRQEALVEGLRDSSIVVLIGICLLGLGGGLFFSQRVLRPVRGLTDAVRHVQSGDMSRRIDVPAVQGELAELEAQFNLMLDQIEQLVVSMRDAFDGVGHDLRMPLSRMRARIESALLNEVSYKEQREVLMDCAEEVERISILVRTLLDVTLAESGQMTLSKEKFFINELCEDVCSLYEMVAEERGIRLEYNVESYQIYGDRTRLMQALANLVDNAVKYSPDNGVVVVAATEELESAMVIVNDSGEGVPVAERERIFEKFYREDKSRSTKGLGLGLSLVSAVMKAHGGSVSIGDGVFGGAEVTMRLPR